jgi:hypothetical protein
MPFFRYKGLTKLTSNCYYVHPDDRNMPLLCNCKIPYFLVNSGFYFKYKTMHFLTHKLLLSSVLLLLTVACKKDNNKDPKDQPKETGQIKLVLENEVDGQALVFNKNSYVNASEDTFFVSKFNYFISNVVWTKTDNSVYAEPSSFHLVKQSDAASRSITIENVPVGNYKSVSFVLGVDSARNVSGAQTGDLDPAKSGDMFWSWNSGYIFLKMEGSFLEAGNPKHFEYHIGGFGGVNKTQRTIHLNFGTEEAKLTLSTVPQVKVKVNLNECFKNPNTMDFKSYPSIIMPGNNARLFADNYSKMFSIGLIQN